MLGKIFNTIFKRSNLPETMTYEEARAVLESESDSAKLELAAHQDARPEMLYYLAEEADDEIRALVASNPNTPLHADRILAEDSTDDVRTELARKIGRLVPGLSPDETTKLREQAIEILEILASDSLVASSPNRSGRNQILQQCAKTCG